MKEASPPVSAMATPTNSSGNLVDEFEEAFQVSIQCFSPSRYLLLKLSALLKSFNQRRSRFNHRQR